MLKNVLSFEQYYFEYIAFWLRYFPVPPPPTSYPCWDKMFLAASLQYTKFSMVGGTYSQQHC